MAQTVKVLPAIQETQGSIPGLGRCPGGGNGNHSSILAWRIPWTEEPVKLRPWGRKVSDTAERIEREREE